MRFIASVSVGQPQSRMDSSSNLSEARSLVCVKQQVNERRTAELQQIPITGQSDCYSRVSIAHGIPFLVITGSQRAVMRLTPGRSCANLVPQETP